MMTLPKKSLIFGFGLLVVSLTLPQKVFPTARHCCLQEESDHFYWRTPKEFEPERSTAWQKLEKVYQDLTQVISNTRLPKRWVLFQGANRGDWQPSDHSRWITYPQKSRPVFELLFLRNWRDYLLYFQTFLSWDPLGFEKERDLWGFLFDAESRGRDKQEHPLLLGLSLYLEERFSYDRTLWASLRKLALRQIPPQHPLSWHRLPNVFPFNPELGQALVAASFWSGLEGEVSKETFDQFLKQRDKPWQVGFQETFQISFEAAWKNFVANRYQRAFSGEPEGIALGETKIKKGKGGLGLKVSPDSEWLGYLRRSFPQFPLSPKVIRLKKSGGRTYRRIKQDTIHLSWLEDSEGLILEKYFRNRFGLLHSSPHLLVLKQKAHDLLLPTKARCATYWKVSNRILFVEEEQGIENIYGTFLGRVNVTEQLTFNDSPRLIFSCPVILERTNGMLFSLLDERGLETLIYYDFSIGGLSKLLPMPGHQIHPSLISWGPIFILFSAEVEGRFAIYVYNTREDQLYLLVRENKDLFFPTATASGDLFAMSLAQGKWNLEQFKVPLPLENQPLSPYSPETFPQIEPTLDAAPSEPEPPPPIPITSTELEKNIAPLKSLPSSFQYGLLLEPVDEGALLGARSRWNIGYHGISLGGGLDTRSKALQGKLHYRYHGFLPYLEFKGQEEKELINTTGEIFSRALIQTGFLAPLFQERGGLGFGFAFNGMSRLGLPTQDRSWFAGPYLSLHVPMDPPLKKPFFRNWFTTELDGFYWVDAIEGTEPHHPEITLRSGGQLLWGRIGLATAVEAGYLRNISLARRAFEIGGEKTLSYLLATPPFLIRGYPFQGERSQRPLTTQSEIRFYLGNLSSEPFSILRLE